VGQRIVRLETVVSTNSLAADLAEDPANGGIIVWAEQQTAGRGRLGRAWLSPPGHGVWLSALLFPPEPLRRPVILTALAAVAVCETISRLAALPPTIKWPNDVLVHGHKVCGILVEQARGTVIGIGINVNTPAEVFAAAHLALAGSLAMFTGRPLDREPLVECLLDRLDEHYANLHKGQLADLESRWRRFTGLLGQEVSGQAHERPFRGRLVEMTFENIILQDPGGALRAWPPEAVVAMAAAP
jgi:BirA family biotin operon repressor/biotin-[acetyl-CoA-carboxylase] ligase